MQAVRIYRLCVTKLSASKPWSAWSYLCWLGKNQPFISIHNFHDQSNKTTFAIVSFSDNIVHPEPKGFDFW